MPKKKAIKWIPPDPTSAAVLETEFRHLDAVLRMFPSAQKKSILEKIADGKWHGRDGWFVVRDEDVVLVMPGTAVQS